METGFLRLRQAVSRHCGEAMCHFCLEELSVFYFSWKKQPTLAWFLVGLFERSVSPLKEAGVPGGGEQT